MVRAGPLHGQGRGFESLTAHQPSLSGAELRLGEPNPKGKAVAPKRNARRRTKRKKRAVVGYHYVYMLSDIATHSHHYVGMTSDLEARLEKHNSCQVPHTSKFAPWMIDAAIAVRDKNVASHLEQYFKSGAGRAFAKKHIFPQI